MPPSSTQFQAERLLEELPPLPVDMRQNHGRERARYAFVTRTLEVLRTDTTLAGERVEDWRRVSRQLVMLWQMSTPGDFRLAVAGLELISREAELLEPACAGGPVGTGPHGGNLLFPWQATPGDWVAVPGGLVGPLEETSMAMPNLGGIARTVVIIDQSHRFHRGGAPQVDVFLHDGTRIEQLDSDVERAKAHEQWEKDREEWYRR
ncbi:hypothetical protein [Streptomyces graminilatus]|uniref:hypothetical protein n=1 Tax=Streptomyces graminilatus TaxID=1464070 RepID=UPI0006E31F3F|nr:hypothetical protein [Streptomyces graminilatus]